MKTGNRITCTVWLVKAKCDVTVRAGTRIGESCKRFELRVGSCAEPVNLGSDIGRCDGMGPNAKLECED